MQRILTAITAFALALSMLATAQAAPAAAAGEINSDYFGESAFLNLAPGQAGQFAVGFNNTGSAGWQTGTATQVDLVICQADKVTCNTPSPNSAWASNWLSATAYTTQSTSFVGPGQTGWFVYAVRAPGTATTGTTARFNGDLALHQTSALIHQQGYYQDATVAANPNPPTAMTLTPAFQGKQIGQTATLTANVTADPPTGSTTRQPVANQEVTFQVPAAGLNPAITATSITDSSGNATFSYTRNNPGADSVTAYVTGTPTVRATATVNWGTAATTISVTPDDAVTMPNTTVGSSSSCRTYNVSARDLNGDGTAFNAAGAVEANFVENLVTSANTAASGANADAKDGGATIGGAAVENGVNQPLTLSGGTATSPATGTVAVCGNGSTKTVTLIVWQDNNPADNFLGNELADSGGSITFQSRTPTVAVTPDTAASMAVEGQRVFTVTATDQFGSPFAGALTIGSVEATDDFAGTTTGAVVAWWDNTLASGALETSTGANCATPPAGASSGAVGTASVVGATPEATTGSLTFALCSTTATSATATAYQEKAGGLNGTREADETAGDTGGATTWAAAVLTSCTIAVDRSTAPTSAGVGEPNTTTAGVPDGNVTYTISLKNQGGAAFSATGDFKYAISNTGSNGLVADTTNTAVAAGTTTTLTHAGVTASSDTIILDAAATTSASVAGSFVRTSDGATFTCGTATNSWIQASDAQSLPAGSTITGTVIFVDKTFGGSGTTTDGFGAYVLQTSGSGNYYVSFDSTTCTAGPGPITCTNDIFTIVGTASSGVQFEAALTVGDVVTVTTQGAQPAGAYDQNMTTNAP